MRYRTTLFSGALVAAGLASATLAAVPAVRAQGSQVQNASSGVMLAVGRGTLVKLDRPMSDVFIADPAIADIQVRSPSLLYIFGKGPGETSLYATDKAGAVVYSGNEIGRATVITPVPNAQHICRLVLKKKKTNI